MNWPKLLVFQAAVNSGLVALAVAAIVGTVIGAYYYLKIVKVMYMDEPGAMFARVRQPVQGALIFLAAVAVGDARRGDIENWNPVESSLTPNPRTAAVYERQYRIFRQLYERTKDLMAELSGGMPG